MSKACYYLKGDKHSRYAELILRLISVNTESSKLYTFLGFGFSFVFLNSLKRTLCILGK